MFLFFLYRNRNKGYAIVQTNNKITQNTTKIILKKYLNKRLNLVFK